MAHNWRRRKDRVVGALLFLRRKSSMQLLGTPKSCSRRQRTFSWVEILACYKLQILRWLWKVLYLRISLLLNETFLLANFRSTCSSMYYQLPSYILFKERKYCPQSCAHGTDKDVYMSVPCVIGREGVYCTVRQKLSEQEKSAVQTCADSIRSILRESGILQETNHETE